MTDTTAAAVHVRNPDAARRRLEILTDRVRDPERQQLAPGSTMTLAAQDWDHYLRVHLRLDAPHLAKMDPTALDVALHALGASGRGWPARAKQIATAVKRHAPPKLRLVDRSDPDDDAGEMQRDPATWGQLAKSPDGRKAAGTLSNVARVLECDPHWQDRIAYDEHARRVTIDDIPVTDADGPQIAIWLDRTYGIVATPATVLDALEVVGRLAPFHPVRDYLSGLTWDGTPRLSAMAERYLGAVVRGERHRMLVQVMARKWMVAAVARAFRPGCKVKAALLLVGPQSAGKTPAFQVLGGPWYTRSRVDPKGVDGQIGLAGTWIWEIAEIGGIFKSRAPEDIKAFLDLEDDRYRARWGRIAESRPRMHVWGATDNDEQLLRDPTGATRWWPIYCARVDLDALRRDRDQLWAEARVQFEAGAQWWLTPEEEVIHAEIAEMHTAREAWQDVLAGWLYGAEDRPTSVTTSEALRHLEGAGRYAAAGATPHAIGRWLRSLGWVERTGTRAERAQGRRTVWEPGAAAKVPGDPP